MQNARRKLLVVGLAVTKSKASLERLLQAVPPDQAREPALQAGDRSADDARQLLRHGSWPRGAAAGAGALEQYLLFNRLPAYSAKSSVQLFMLEGCSVMLEMETCNVQKPEPVLCCVASCSQRS